MPRTARLQGLGLPFHVIVQGIARCPLFQDDFDRTGLLVRASRIITEMGIDMLAWSLMDNHVHFGLRANDAPLSKAMQRTLLRGTAPPMSWQEFFGLSQGLARPSDFL